MFWAIIISLGIAWALQSVLSLRQLKTFSDAFCGMRRDGRVAMGKFKGAIVSGAIVMFCLDDEDRILYGRRLHGITVLARFHDFDLYNGQLMGEIDHELTRARGRSLTRAVSNARDNFRVHQSGLEPVEPPTALGRLLARLPLPRKKKPAPTPVAVTTPKKVIPRPAPVGAR